MNNLPNTGIWGFDSPSYDDERNFYMRVICALDPDNGYMIAQWADKDRILAASTDPDEDPNVIPAHFADVPDGNKSHLEEPVIAVNSYTEYTHGLVSVGVFYGTVCLGDMKISLAFMGKMFYYKQCE